MDKASKQVAKSQMQRVLYYKQVFSGPQGAYVLEDLMKAHHMEDPTYDGNVDEMLIREGERRAVLRIMKILKINVQELRERIAVNEQHLED